MLHPQVEPALVAVNQQLRQYKAAWDVVVDSWLVIRMADPQWVFSWRKQAEDKMKEGGKPGMSDEQVGEREAAAARLSNMMLFRAVPAGSKVDDRPCCVWCAVVGQSWCPSLWVPGM
jgi:pantothenate kinase-related protein Tda10